MKKTFLILVFLSFLFSLFASPEREVPIFWTELRSKYNWKTNPIFPESESVELFESILYTEGRLLLQTKDVTKQNSLLVWNLDSGESKKIDWDGGKVTGWAECSGRILVQTTKTLWDLDAKTFLVKRKLPWPNNGKSWQDIVCLENKIYKLVADQLEVYGLDSGELESKIPLPFSSVQRMTKRSEKEILLISSYWGNTVQVFSPKDPRNSKEWKIPVNHRALFKLVTLSENHFLIFDPITKTYGEWMVFENSILPLDSPIEVADGSRAYRFSPIQNKIEYKFSLTALSDVPETKYQFVLPKQNISSQRLSEEEFDAASILETDDFGNRSLVLTLPPLKAGDTKEIKVYSALLTRYKIHWNLDPKLTLGKNQNRERLESFLMDDWFLKMDSDVVLEKRKTIFRNETNLKQILTKTQEYVSSIPYQSGSFESAPKVIEKNNGGCTEHSYVTMALLRGMGIPSRLVWNYLPTESSKEITFNHKFVEVWVEGLGWIPMEPLAPPKSKPGITYARHVVFAGLSGTSHPKIVGGDRLVQLSKDQLGLAKKIKFKLVVAKMDTEKGIENTDEKVIVPKTIRALNSGEDLVVP
ncbi:transglutaminase domain-containing protein [Leptospira bourretii]|uniref:Transglutaminase domain-containing protein n=1 Tax=Leptospira bourretii TaxID=2484962 RepID=A0A4R9IML9_9LEPT|nr:transglutaminase-like domain-containing protein [Leptospira bourretii]TGK84946.1 transglutaminase domain-containing protein [Leptospira bourretii]TGK90711.1 transglutaminase domain-containing protein [Leptospira bourretii]TGL23555.1 transglutaminase domain-containing protein [Leptospira bourretii]TGL35896.1 transglutaminase domain-containing protein [Leptospira bourretii]